MSVSAADSVAPLAVLVLAWDETTPAVRALVEATHIPAPAVDSILVLVPQADAPEALSAEEYLPLPTPLPPVLTTAVFPPGPAAPAVPAAADELAAAPLLPAKEPAPEPAAEPVALATLVPLPVWTAVRVLRLSGLALPALASLAGQPLPAPAWTGPATAPAAPYIGSAGLAPAPTEEAAALPVLTLLEAPVAAPPAALPALAAQPAAASPPRRAAPLYEPAEPLALAPDLEADLLPTEASGLASFAAPSPDLLAAPAALAPEQAGWAEALASLQRPATEPLAPAEATPGRAGLPPVCWPAASHYPAPDLNFQVIQYARFAVPVALAEPPFQVIYAPAWPTWLAAQELRYRTGRPLVLHVATLAAPEGESLETAAGWMPELQRQALRRADLVLTETVALAHRLRHELGLPASAVRTVPAADAAAIAQALHTAQPRPTASGG